MRNETFIRCSTNISKFLYLNRINCFCAKASGECVYVFFQYTNINKIFYISTNIYILSVTILNKYYFSILLRILPKSFLVSREFLFRIAHLWRHANWQHAFVSTDNTAVFLSTLIARWFLMSSRTRNGESAKKNRIHCSAQKRPRQRHNARHRVQKPPKKHRRGLMRSREEKKEDNFDGAIKFQSSRLVWRTRPRILIRHPWPLFFSYHVGCKSREWLEG